MALGYLGGNERLPTLVSLSRKADNGQMTRVLITAAPGTDPGRLVQALSELGPVSVTPPDQYLPDVYIVDTDASAANEFLEQAAAIPGVVTAEPDGWAFTQDAPATPPTLDPPATGPGSDPRT